MAEKKHLIFLLSAKVEVRCSEAPGDDEVWINDGSAIFTIADWVSAVQFVDRVRNF
jgi:hypothetical protein